ncbi:MAG: hypothetical protein ACOH13_09835 [Flavobacteriales bacterium]
MARPAILWNACTSKSPLGFMCRNSNRTNFRHKPSPEINEDLRQPNVASNYRMIRLSILLAPVVISCGSQIPDDYALNTIDLNNNLGQLSISLPIELDTSYSWTGYTDYRCGARQLIRFVDTDYSMLQETGFLSADVPDSLYQMTISQPKHKDCADFSDVLDKSYIDNYTAARLKENITVKFAIAEIQSINNRYFAVFAEQSRMKDKDNATLQATTIIDGSTISVTFSCHRRDCEAFLKRMEKSLKTLKITAGNNG